MGWQPERSFVVESPPLFLSFCTVGGDVFLWGKQTENRIFIYDVLRDTFNYLEPAAEHTQLIRVGRPGELTLNLTNDGLPDKWLFPQGYSSDDLGNDRQREDESQLIVHARQLLAEKKQLESELAQKETSLAQYRMMLGMAR